MNKTVVTFEIWDITTNEVLSNNLDFDNLPELLDAYQALYPTHRIEGCYREVTVTERVNILPSQQFKTDWYNLLDEIIDNLYNS